MKTTEKTLVELGYTEGEIAQILSKSGRLQTSVEGLNTDLLMKFTIMTKELQESIKTIENPHTRIHLGGQLDILFTIIDEVYKHNNLVKDSFAIHS